MEFTLHDLMDGEHLKVNVAWSDHNHVPQKNEVVIGFHPQDKPRSLRVMVDGVLVAEIPSATGVYRGR